MTTSRAWRQLAVVAVLSVVGLLLGLAAPTAGLAQSWPYDGRIVGTVTDGGQPAADVRVTVYEASSWYYRGTTTTDATGSYVMTGLAPYGSYKVEFTTSDYRRQWAHQQRSFDTAQAFTLAPGQDTVVDEVLFPTGTLVLTAVDKVSGAPVERFYGEAWGDGIGRNGNTDNGTLTLSGLLPGDYQVAVYPGETHFEARTTATVTANETTAVRLELEPAAVLAMTVVDAATNAPVENACVQPVGELTPLGPSLGNCTGPDGRITAGRLRTGSYRIFTLPRDGVHGAQWAGTEGGTGSRYLAKAVEARAGETVTVPPIRLDLAGSITGTVVDKATGAPVAAMCAYPFATSTDAGPERGPHCSDEQGRYTVTGLGPYSWPVEFVGDYTNSQYAWHWSGGRPNQLVAQPVPVQVGQTATLNTQLFPGAKVRGRVVAADGTPVNGAVFAFNALTGDPAAAYALTDENGYYEVTSLSGQFVRLRFDAMYPDNRSFWYRDASDFRSARPVWVPSGGTTSGIDFVIPNG